MIETIAFDFGRVIAHFDHGRTLGKLTAYTDMPQEEMFAHIYGGDLEDEFESGRIGEQEFLRRLILSEDHTSRKRGEHSSREAQEQR